MPKQRASSTQRRAFTSVDRTYSVSAMDGLVFPTTARSLGDALGAEIVGTPDAPVDRLSTLAEAGEGCLTFCASAKYLQSLESAKPGAVVFTRAEWVSPGSAITYLVVDDPQASFAKVARAFSAEWHQPPGISALASVHPDATISAGATVCAFAVVEKDATIGEGTFIGSHTVVGAKTQIGKNCTVHPRVTLFPGCIVGDRTQIFSGTVIGSDGFGIFGHGSGSLKEMPQVGSVEIGSDVRIGANCCIDRGTIGNTRIDDGVKLDNLVQVGHNVWLQSNVVLCAQAAIGGSVVVEKNVILGGQVGIGHGVTIGENARLGGQAGVSTDVPGNQTYSFSPALPVRQAHQIHRYTLKLPELFRRVRALEKAPQKESDEP
jgi:UDP-3-O-[3-hydroxymyristoyl] glucosamine N-acyltransferase